MKKILCVLIVIVLAGCQAHSVSKPPAADFNLTHPATAQQYVYNATSAIQSRFYDVDTYKGRECNIRIHQVNGYQPDSVKADSGDSQLCEAALSAAKQAIEMGTYPFKPTDIKSKLPDDISLRFRPQ